MSIFDKIGDIATGVANAGTMGLAGKVIGSTQTKYKATPYDVQGDQYNDPYLDANRAALTQANADRQAMATPMAQGPDFSQSDQMRAMQIGGMQNLAAAANGQVPSAAQIQGQQQLANALQQQAGMAASMRGVSPALAQHIAAQQGAQLQGQALDNAAQLRANEQMQARNAFVQAMQGARGQDLSAAGLQQNTTLANQQAALAAQQQRDAMAQYYTSQRMGAENNQFNANMGWDQARQQAYEAGQGINAGIAQGNAGAKAQMIGGLLSAGGSAMASGLKSDENAKEAIDRADTGRDIDSFIKALDTASWRYKPGVGEDTEKRRWGVMAQSLLKSKIGQSLVGRGEDGFLRIDTTQGFGAVLAAQRRLNDRLEALEKVRRA